MTVKKVLKKIIRNGIEYEFPTSGGGGGGSDLDIGGVSAIVDMKLGDYDSLFSITSGLYKILNAIDTDDEIGLSSGESWSQIVSNATSMSKISHCYAVMCYIANSSVAMNQIVGNSSATKEISECWNSITIIAENQLSSDIYLGSVNGLTYLFAYTTAQDAFFTSTERKTEIISDNIMVIVNNNTLLTNINDDPVVEVVIASSEEAMLAIVASTDKLDIVDENSVIMTGIATNATALTAMSDQNFTSYILENHDYLVACTSDDDGKARINSMAADDLLPAIFYWTGLSGYSTFADLAANDSAMEIVQSNTESMLIIESNDEAMEYVGNIPAQYQEVEYIENSSTGPYIDTGLNLTNLSMIQMKVRPLMVTGDVIFGDNPGNDTIDYRLFNYSSQYYFDLPGGSGSGNRIMGGSFPSGQDREIEIGNFYVKNKGESSNIISGSTVGTFTTSFTAKLNGVSKATARWYYVKIYENSELVMNLFACYRKSDNVVGMYDKVSKTFFTNSGSGSFTAGDAYKREP